MPPYSCVNLTLRGSVAVTLKEPCDSSSLLVCYSLRLAWGHSPDPPAVGPPPGARTVRAWPADVPAGDMPGRFALILHRQADEGVESKLEVHFLPDTATASLFYPTAARRATDALSPLESAELRKLTERSRLDEGGHIGYVGATLETLAFRDLENGRTVVLVTGGNKNFVEDPARRALLQRLRALEERLLSGSAPSR